MGELLNDHLEENVEKTDCQGKVVTWKQIMRRIK